MWLISLIMALLDHELAPVEASDVAEMVSGLQHSMDEKRDYEADVELTKRVSSSDVSANEYEVDEKLYNENGKEKVLETAEDFSRALVSSDDDPNLIIHTFRMWFTGVGLAVFGAVLGMLFVSTKNSNYGAHA